MHALVCLAASAVVRYGKSFRGSDLASFALSVSARLTTSDSLLETSKNPARASLAPVSLALHEQSCVSRHNICTARYGFSRSPATEDGCADLFAAIDTARFFCSVKSNLLAIAQKNGQNLFEIA